jgi:hypothetical protein
MDSSVLPIIISLVLSLLGGIATKYILGTSETNFNNKSEKFAERIKSLTKKLEQSSIEVDIVLKEISKVAEERSIAIKNIEVDLTTLQIREKELKEKIEHLEKTPLPVAEYFVQLTTQSEKRSARRDYLLFGAGAVISTIITIILKLVFGI